MEQKQQPLASRMRPQSLDEIMGQKHILGTGSYLRRAIQADCLQSAIFYGPPGTGKTTLANVIACTTKSKFLRINATAAGKKDMESAVAEAMQAYEKHAQKTVLFIDEIHRFNKAQQDYLLPRVEDGTVTLIGATTENPYFEVNNALLSRSTVFELKPLSPQDIAALLGRAIGDNIRGLGGMPLDIEPDAVAFLSEACAGDARQALNALELAAATTPPRQDGSIRITVSEVKDSIQKRTLRYDRDGDCHYDTISAFIKSMRGSDPDAAVYYLAKMLEAGEDIKFIARRIMVHASEDVGMADPSVLWTAVSAAQAVERIGMPEAQIILAHAAIAVACAPKSNSVANAISSAMEAVKRPDSGIPPHLLDAHYKGAAKLGHGLGYLYPHDYQGHFVPQQYLPDSLYGARFYTPSDMGNEKQVAAYVEWARQMQKHYAPPKTQAP